MSQVDKNINKSLQVSDSVVAGIVTNAVKDINGVYGIAPMKKTIRQLLLKEESVGDIKVGLVDDVLSLTVGIIVKDGVNVVSVAEQVQDIVKNSVQSMLGLTVAKVNVTIRGIKYE